MKRRRAGVRVRRCDGGKLGKSVMLGSNITNHPESSWAS